MVNWEYEFFVGNTEVVVQDGTEPEACSIRDKPIQGLVERLHEESPAGFGSLNCINAEEENPQEYILQGRGEVFEVRLSDSRRTSPVKDWGISKDYWLVSKGIKGTITYGPAMKGDAVAIALFFESLMKGISHYYTGKGMEMNIPLRSDFPRVKI